MNRICRVRVTAIPLHDFVTTRICNTAGRSLFRPQASLVRPRPASRGHPQLPPTGRTARTSWPPTFPRKRLVRGFTKRFHRNFLHNRRGPGGGHTAYLGLLRGASTFTTIKRL